MTPLFGKNGLKLLPIETNPSRVCRDFLLHMWAVQSEKITTKANKLSLWLNF